MLHLHALIWVQGNLGFSTLWDQILSDDVFAARMVQYLENIIVHSLDESLFSGDILPNSMMPSPTNIAESDLDFSHKLSQDSNHIASIK
jgi:hypothetical protein